MIIKKLKKGLLLSMMIASLLLQTVSAEGVILYMNDDDYTIDQSTLIINQEDANGDMKLQFGDTLDQYLLWDENNSYFSLSDDLNMNGNQLINFRVENSSTQPTCDTNSLGRQYYNTVSDNPYICTEESAGVYNWVNFTTTTTSSSKVVTVGTGGNYATLVEAATYLNSLTGGIILLTPENHQVTTAVNLQNINILGASETDTKITVTGAGQLDVKDSEFNNLVIEADSSLISDFAIDVHDGTGNNSAVVFKWVNFITESGKVLMNSSDATAPTVVARFASPSSSIAGNATIIPTVASTNFNSASTFFVGAQGGNGSLDFSDWPLSISGSANARTTGTITTYPDKTIYAYPGMDLQSLINSLPNGGIITLLPGVHEISETLLINNDSIEIIGYGESSVIRTVSFTGSSTTTGAIQIGSADGTSPVDNIILKDFRLEIGNFTTHGIRATGGQDIQLYNISVIKTAGQGGTGSSARNGIEFLDGTSEDLVRPVIKNCRVFGTQSSNAYFTDGIHVSGGDGYGSSSGVWTNGNSVKNALIESNNVDYVRETAAVFVGVQDSSLFNNRFSRMGTGGTNSFGIFIGDSARVNMTTNVISGSLSTTAEAVVIESFGAPASRNVVDSNFSSNTIDGTADSGLGFELAFAIGDTDADTEVHRNIFQGNVIKGASNSTTIAFDLQGNNDDNVFMNNILTGGTYSWDTGLSIGTGADRTFVRNNKYENTTVHFTDNGTNTSLDVSSHSATSDPTVSDDINDGYEIGTIWINTSTDTSFINVDNTAGSAIWTATGGTSSDPTITATSDPTVSDDINDGYEIGTIWINTSTDTSFINVDNTADNAVWKQTNNLLYATSTSDPTVNDDINDGYEIGSIWINTSTNNAFVNISNTASSAVWKRINNLLYATSTSDPTTSDDINDGYEIGSIWINTSTDTSFINVDNTAGSAVWKQTSNTARVMAQFYDSSGGTNLNVTTAVAIPFNQETLKDTGITHSTITNSSRTYFDSAGVYQVSYNVSHSDADNNNNKNILCQVRKNGSTYVIPSASYGFSYTSADEISNTASFIMETTSTNEYIEVLCIRNGNTGTSSTIANQSWILVEKK